MTMTVTGIFDQDLFRRYRSLPSVPKKWEKWSEEQRDQWARDNPSLFERTEERRQLEGQLVLDNTPLAKILVAQYRGEDNTPPRRGFTKAKREPGAEGLSWEEAYACGLTGLIKALRGLNLAKGGFTKYTAWKIRHELQSAITKSQVVSIPKGSEREDRPKGFDFFEDEDEMQRALLGQREEQDRAIGQGERPTQEEIDSMPCDSVGRCRWCGYEGPGPRHSCKGAPRAEPEKPARVSSAIIDFIERRIVLDRLATLVWARVVPLYRVHALTLGFPVAPWMLEDALVKRGARRVTVIDDQAFKNVRRTAAQWLLDLVEEPGLAGVRLRTVADP
jgi:hypothetical protein